MTAPGEQQGLRSALLRWTNLPNAAGQPRGSSGSCFPYTHHAERASSLGSLQEGPGSPAGAHWHREGVPELHEEEDPAPGPAVAAGGAAPRAEAGGTAARPETRTGALGGQRGKLSLAQLGGNSEGWPVVVDMTPQVFGMWQDWCCRTMGWILEMGLGGWRWCPAATGV